ncbi:MAG: MerR family transcriptional regulator [Clostridiales bacterium]|nr:MerR family transcriptional regulator [Clostridiales bacterium]
MATDGLSIGRAAQQLGVSARTLRYYGELGLLDGARRGAGEYRTYDEAALARARQILVLRKLRVPLSSIGAILRSSDARLAIEAFEANIAAIDGELAALQSIRAVLRALVAKLRDAAVWPDALPSGEAIERAARSLLPAIKDAKEDATMDDLNRAGQQLGKLTDVRMLYLPPATVAASHYIGEEPERHAGERLDEFARASRLWEIKPDMRMYGFNHPNPSAERPVYGYEFWLTIPDDLDVPAPLVKKRFPGGLYAAHVIRMGDFHEWEWLWDWAQRQTDYAPNFSPEGDEVMHGLLEEHLNYVLHVQTDRPRPGDMQLDLLLPMTRKQPADG